MKVINFPTKLPTPEQLEAPRLMTAALLQDLTRELTSLQHEMMMASNAAAFAVAARKTSDKLTAASLGFASIVGTIRDSWGIKGGA